MRKQNSPSILGSFESRPGKTYNPEQHEIVYQTTVSIDPEYVHSEDSGAALIAEAGTGEDEGFFVQLHSWAWDDPQKHDLFKSLIGKTVRVTVEIVEKRR